MVELKKINKGNKEYYYLVHSYRQGKQVKKKQIYLGISIPKALDEKKKEFIQEFYKERFLGDIDKIKKNFNKQEELMPKSAKEKQKENFAIKFTYDSQRIEGSTLSLKDTADFLEKGITPNSKPINDVKEAEAHKKIFEDMMNYQKDLSLQIIMLWNKKLLEQTKQDIAGKIRPHAVGIARSKFVPPLAIEIEFLLKDFFDWYNKNKSKLHPIELAALIHLKFVTIHPFADGNWRISRIMMNFILKRHKFPLLNIPYTKRTSYYNALERSQMKKQEHIFVQWFFKRYLQEYKKYIK